MASYRPFFGIQVEHGYSDPDPCGALEFRPDRATGSLLNRAGIVFRTEPDGFQTYCDGADEELLRSWVDDPRAPFRMVFRVVASDPAFLRYSQLDEESMGRVLLLDTEDQDANEPVRLDDVDGGLPEADEETRSEVTTRGDMRVPPLAVLVVRVGPSILEESAPAPYRLAFEARRTRWRYHLLGELAGREEVSIRASENGAEPIAFQAAGLVDLPGGRVARVLVSDAPLATRKRTDRRLQLREGDPGNGRILIRRLPVASPEDLSIATVEGRRTLVSDIYVHS